MILLQARILEFKIYSQINLKYTLQKTSSKQTARCLYNHNLDSDYNLTAIKSLVSAGDLITFTCVCIK